MRSAPLQHPPVLLYHDLPASGAVGGRSLAGVAMFRRQMRYLAAHNYRTLTAEEFIAALNEPAQTPSNSILITFDDGYLDFYEHAFPVLTELGLTATAFLITDVLERGIAAWRGPHYLEMPSTLSWEQVVEMSRSGISFGSHGHTHRKMNELAANEAADETERSKALLEERLGKPVSLFAYPYGAVNEIAKDAVREAGFAAALAWTSQGTDRFELPRRAIAPARGMPSFRLRLSRTYPVLRRLAHMNPFSNRRH